MVGWGCIKVFRMSLLYLIIPCIAIYGIVFFLDFDQIKQGICLRNSFALFKIENNQTMFVFGKRFLN